MAKPHDQGSTVKGLAHSAWPHGGCPCDQELEDRGLCPSFDQKWVFKPYIMILIDF
jgi:hypothetical protein